MEYLEQEISRYEELPYPEKEDIPSGTVIINQLALKFFRNDKYDEISMSNR